MIIAWQFCFFGREYVRLRHSEHAMASKRVKKLKTFDLSPPLKSCDLQSVWGCLPTDSVVYLGSSFSTSPPLWGRTYGPPSRR